MIWRKPLRSCLADGKTDKRELPSQDRTWQGPLWVVSRPSAVAAKADQLKAFSRAADILFWSGSAGAPTILATHQKRDSVWRNC